MTGNSPSPIERVITRLHNEGATPSQIGSKVGKKPGTVLRILEMARFREHGDGPSASDDHPLRPLERVVLRLRTAGEGYGEIGNRLGRSGTRVKEIERFAKLKLDEG